MTDIDTQIEEILESYRKSLVGLRETTIAKNYKIEAHKAIKTLLIQQIDDALARQATPTALSKQADNLSEEAI